MDSSILPFNYEIAYNDLSRECCKGNNEEMTAEGNSSSRQQESGTRNTKGVDNQESDSLKVAIDWMHIPPP